VASAIGDLATPLVKLHPAAAAAGSALRPVPAAAAVAAQSRWLLLLLLLGQSLSEAQKQQHAVVYG
jgi:hypothetical protein